jgi:oligosaccharyltransferase complex subunit gamma
LLQFVGLHYPRETSAQPANNDSDGVLSFATIALALKVPRIADAKTQGVAVMAWSAVVFLMYSFLLSIFRFKNGGYPFFLPPF